jgi:hypothetical protein
VITVRRAVDADLPAVVSVWMAAEGIGGEHDPLPLHVHELATGLPTSCTLCRNWAKRATFCTLCSS